MLVTKDNHKRLTEYLASHPCIDCGCGNMRVLEFDHVGGGKSKDISKMMSIGCSWPTIEAEIAKCQVRCATCHRIRKSEKGGFWRQRLDLKK